jgi:CheY-like chemotaxis protein
MSGPEKIEAALLVSSRWRSRPNHIALGDLMARSGIILTIVDSLEEAHALLSAGTRAQCVILDADSSPPAIDVIGTAIRRLRSERSDVAPIVIATLPSTRLVTAAFRAGAADVVDLATSDEAALLDSLAVAARDHRAHAARAARVNELRQLIDEFLRVLVRAERRTIELEEAAAEASQDNDKDVAPQVLVVEDDRDVVDHLAGPLAEVGVQVHTAASGEQALELFRELSRAQTPVDLALVDKNLPGMSGLDCIRTLRAEHAGLPCMLMTGFSSGDAAARAADLGVVGYVLKPFDDVVELAWRVKGYALRFAAERRERRYLARIKKKHAQFLERYRLIVADLDRLKD